MLKRICGVALLAVGVVTLTSATWYVKPAARGGLNSNSGVDSANAFATIAKGVSVAQVGDVVKVLGGHYNEPIESVRDGNSGAYITIDGDVTNPNNVSATGAINIFDDYISVRGFRITGAGKGCWVESRNGSPGQSDSVSWCWIMPSDTAGAIGVNGGDKFAQPNPWLRKAHYFVFTDNHAVVRELFISTWADEAYCDVSACDGDSTRHRFLEFSDNNITMLKGGAAGIWMMRGVHWSKILRNRIRLIWQMPNSGASGWIKLYFHAHNTYQDNHWFIDDRRGGLSPPAFYCYQRDSAGFNSWTRDTFDISTSQALFQLPGYTSGNERGDGGTSGHSAFRDCLVRNRMGDGIIFQANMNSDTLQRTTIATTGKPIQFYRGFEGDNVMEHCTVVDSMPGAWVLGPEGKPWAGTFKFRSNLLYSKDKLGTDRAAVRIKLPRGAAFESNYNFSVMYDTLAVFGDRSISYLTTEPDGSQASPVSFSRPDSIPWRTLAWGQFTLNDVNSRFTGRAAAAGSPLQSGKAGPKFADSTIATFDPTLTSGSGAQGVGEGGSDAGAKQLTAADAVRPDDPQDAYVATFPLPDQIALDFTATGDDSLTGRAHHYEVRYSTEVINAGNFDLATPFPTPQIPALPGAIDRLIVTGLRPTTDYWFAIKVADEAGNRSAISNVVTARTGGAGGGINFIEP